jgi:FixJ family two-component response regulator
MALATLIRDVLADFDALRKKLEAIQMEVEAESKEDETHLLKKPNGRLTEAGVRRLYAMIGAGYTDAEIARAFAIRQSSVAPHRKRVLSERTTVRSGAP